MMAPDPFVGEHARVAARRPARLMKADQRIQTLDQRGRGRRPRRPAADALGAMSVHAQLPARFRRDDVGELGRPGWHDKHRSRFAVADGGLPPSRRCRAEQRRIRRHVEEIADRDIGARIEDSGKQGGSGLVRRIRRDQRVEIVARSNADRQELASAGFGKNIEGQDAVEPIASASHGQDRPRRPELPPPGKEPSGRLERRASRHAPP